MRIRSSTTHLVVVRVLVAAVVTSVLGAVVLLHLLLPVHHAGPAARLLPRVVKLDQAGDRFVRKLTMIK